MSLLLLRGESGLTARLRFPFIASFVRGGSVAPPPSGAAQHLLLALVWYTE